MRDGSAWEMEVCEYCFERMHRAQIEEHKHLVHRDVIDAEDTVKGLTEREKKGLLAVGVWLGLETLIVFILVALGIETSMPYVLAVAGVFIGIGVIGLAIQLSTPKQVKEARKKAREVILKRKVRCDVCGSMVAFEDYSSHIRRYHPKKMPYEWYRVAILVLLALVAGGGYIAVGLLAEAEILSDNEFVLLIVSWIAGSCLILLWMVYEYHVGELRHIQKMRRHWEEHRYDPKDGKSE